MTDAERLAAAERRHKNHTSDEACLACFLLSQMVRLQQERDTALRDAEALRADLKLHQGMHAVTIEQYEALRREVARLREGLIPKSSPRPPFVIDPEYAADTKSLRHPLTGDTVVVSTETGRILETRPAASGEDVGRSIGWPFRVRLRPDGTRYVSSVIFPGFHFILAPEEDVDALTDAFCQFLALRDAAARLSGAEMAKLDKPVIAAARRMPRATPAPGGAFTVHKFEIEAGAVWALDRALATRDAALKALPEDVR